MKKVLIPILATAIALPVLAADNDKATAKKATGTYLGVAMDQIPPLTRAQLDIPKGVGVAVSYVAKDSPAEKAGLKANDIITKLDDQLIINAQQLQTLIESRKVGDETTITYYRKGKKQTTKAKLAKGAMVAQGGARAQPLRLQNGQWQRFPFPGGLGMLRQFNLNPQNQGDFQKQLEELQKQLGQLQDMNPEDWQDLFGQGPGNPEPGNKPPFQFKFDFNLPNGNQDNNNPGNRFEFNAQASSSMTISDNSGSYTLTVNNGKKRFKAKDADGVELFDGPVDTDEQRDGLDRDLIKKLEQLEGMGKGNGGIRLRGLNGNGFKREFKFEFPPRNKPQPEKKGRPKRADA